MQRCEARSAAIFVVPSPIPDLGVGGRFIFFAELALVQPEFLVHRGHGPLHCAHLDDKRNVVLRGACAMAMMLTPSRPSVLKVRPAIPGVPRMFSPTAATIAMLGSTVMCSTC